MFSFRKFFRRRVYFVYWKPAEFYGTTVMRGQQLSEIARRELSGKYKVRYSSTRKKYKNSILFLTKWAIYGLSAGDFKALKRRNNILVFDVVDGKISPKAKRYADVIVAASLTASKKYREELTRSKKIVLIDHHVDPRIRILRFPKYRRSLKIGYFGELANVILSTKIKEKVDVIEVLIAKQDERWFKKLPRYNLHYGVRYFQPSYPDKPFLKGFTAAHCGANILIQSSDKEAIRWLGKDYPYLLKSKPTEKNILNAIKKAEQSFGSEEWFRGLRKMEEIKKKTSDSMVAKQLAKLFDDLED